MFERGGEVDKRVMQQLYWIFYSNPIQVSHQTTSKAGPREKGWMGMGVLTESDCRGGLQHTHRSRTAKPSLKKLNQHETILERIVCFYYK